MPITLDADRVQAGSYKGLVFISTNDPAFPKLTVPISGQILDQ